MCMTFVMCIYWSKDSGKTWNAVWTMYFKNTLLPGKVGLGVGSVLESLWYTECLSVSVSALKLVCALTSSFMKKISGKVGTIVCHIENMSHIHFLELLKALSHLGVVHILCLLCIYLYHKWSSFEIIFQKCPHNNSVLL